MSPQGTASGIGAAVDLMATGSVAAPASSTDGFDSTISRLKRFQETARQQARDESDARDLPAETQAALPAVTAPFDAATFPPGEDGSSEVSFAEIMPPPNEAPLDSSASMKHVRVRSNVDILSELEKLRKVATQRPSLYSAARKSKSAADVSLDDLLGSTRNHKRDVAQSFDLQVPRDTLAKTRHVTVGLSFGDGDGATLGSEKRFGVDFAGLKDVNKLLLSLKFHVKGE
jgi:hypothetical protein